MKNLMEKMLRSNFVLCVLLVVAISFVSVFAADFKIKEGKIKEGIVFGSWTTTDSNSTTLDVNEVYKATSDGFVLAMVNGVPSMNLRALTDSSNPPTTQRVLNDSVHGNNASLMFPVKKDDYWEVTLNKTPSWKYVHWLPVGNGVCEEQ